MAGDQRGQSGKTMTPRERSNANLVKGKGFTREQQRAGGRARAAQMAERRRAREIMQDILCIGMDPAGAELGTLQQAAVDAAHGHGGAISVYQAALMAQAARAVLGDTAAAAFCRDTAGDRPNDKVDVSSTITAGDKALCEAVAARLDEQKIHKNGSEKS